MGKYQVIDVLKKDNNIKVKIETEDGTVKVFGYPLGQGYGDLDMNGEIRAVSLTLKKLAKLEEKAISNETAAELENIKSLCPKTKGRVFSISADTKLIGKRKIKEVDFNGKEIKRNKDLEAI